MGMEWLRDRQDGQVVDFSGGCQGSVVLSSAKSQSHGQSCRLMGDRCRWPVTGRLYCLVRNTKFGRVAMLHRAFQRELRLFSGVAGGYWVMQRVNYCGCRKSYSVSFCTLVSLSYWMIKQRSHAQAHDDSKISYTFSNWIFWPTLYFPCHEPVFRHLPTCEIEWPCDFMNLVLDQSDLSWMCCFLN